MTSFKQSFIAASLGLLLAGNALAVTNGGFSQPGLSGWQKLGDVAKNFGGAVMTTASVDNADDLMDDPGTYNASGLAAAAVGVPGGVEEFAGLAIGGLTLGGNLAYEGSVLRQSFNVLAGETLKFDWVFYTNEYGAASAPDFAFVAIDGALATLASAAEASASSIPFDWTTGTHSFSHTYATSGLSTLAIGVVDVWGTNTTSALWLDKVTLTPPPVPVPEPSNWLLMLAGIGLIGVMVKRRTARH